MEKLIGILIGILIVVVPYNIFIKIKKGRNPSQPVTQQEKQRFLIILLLVIFILTGLLLLLSYIY